MINKITLSGFAGTGKSTVGRQLSETLNFEYISVGNYSRKIAMEKYGLTINAFQELLSRNPDIDQLIDNDFQRYCNNNSNLVIDYRLGFHFIENAYHVLLKVSDIEAFKRISSSKRINEDISSSSIMKRNMMMQERFKKSYGVDFTVESNYDLIIDTSFIPPDKVVSEILSKLKS